MKPIQGKGLRRVSIYKGVHREYFFYIFISRHRINTKCDRKTTVFLYRLQDSVQISVSFKLKHAEKRALFCIKFLTIRPNLQKFDQIFNLISYLCYMTKYYLEVMREGVSICLDTDVQYHHHFNVGDVIYII